MSIVYVPGIKGMLPVLNCESAGNYRLSTCGRLVKTMKIKETAILIGVIS
jgi:hypothetical protein